VPIRGQMDPTVLRTPPLSDVHLGHDLDAGDERRLQVLWWVHDIAQHAIHAEPDPQVAAVRLDVDVAGALLDRVEDQVVYQADDRRFAGHLLKVNLFFLRLNDFDVVFLDARKDEYEDYFAHARRLVEPGALVLADNVLSHEEILGAYSRARQSDPTLVSVTVPLDRGIEVTAVLKP